MKEKYWWLTEESQAMLERGYLLPNQTVEEKLNNKVLYIGVSQINPPI